MPQTELHRLLEGRRWDEARARLASHPAEPKEKDFVQRTPLHLALKYEAPVEVTLALLAAHP
eukprot:COSAG06_NODE_47922_length_335_cov_703.338983_1_plen_61_part_10